MATNTGPLTATYYSDKSIVVRGNTELYREHLKQIGGRWNAHLKDGLGGGWIFPKKKEADVVRVVNQANAGQLQQAAPIPRSTASANTVHTAVTGFVNNDATVINASALNMQLNNAVLTAPEPIIHETEQVVSYKLSIPRVGQAVSVNILANGAITNTLPFEVTSLIRNPKSVVEAIIIQAQGNPTRQGMLLNMNGYWKLDGQSYNLHSVTF